MKSAHAWFNGGLLTDRWANEAFASYYGLEAAAELDVKATADELTPELEAARIPLNAWGAVGREDDKTEDYAYAATLALARDDRRAGRGRRPARGLGRCRGPGRCLPAGRDRRGNGRGRRRGAEPETVDGPPDWRALLDLLEERTGLTYDDLWRTWVARDTDLPLLDARRDARTAYDEVLAAAGEWQLSRAGARCDARLAVRPGADDAR